MIAIRPAILHYRQTKNRQHTNRRENIETLVQHTYNNQWHSFNFLRFYRFYFVNVL